MVLPRKNELEELYTDHQKFRLQGGPPTYEAFTTANPTITIFGLCTHKWGIFALVGDPKQSH